MTENKITPQPAPTLPQYQAPVIQKPGMLGKMLGKMLKLPKGPKMTKMKAFKTPRARKLKKQPHFY